MQDGFQPFLPIFAPPQHPRNRVVMLRKRRFPVGLPHDENAHKRTSLHRANLLQQYAELSLASIGQWQINCICLLSNSVERWVGNGNAGEVVPIPLPAIAVEEAPQIPFNVGSREVCEGLLPEQLSDEHRDYQSGNRYGRENYRPPAYHMPLLMTSHDSSVGNATQPTAAPLPITAIPLRSISVIAD